MTTIHVPLTLEQIGQLNEIMAANVFMLQDEIDKRNQEPIGALDNFTIGICIEGQRILLALHDVLHDSLETAGLCKCAETILDSYTGDFPIPESSS